jgi:hypothetical protein
MLRSSRSSTKRSARSASAMDYSPTRSAQALYAGKLGRLRGQRLE